MMDFKANIEMLLYTKKLFPIIDLILNSDDELSIKLDQLSEEKMVIINSVLSSIDIVPVQIEEMTFDLQAIDNASQPELEAKRQLIIEFLSKNPDIVLVMSELLNLSVDNIIEIVRTTGLYNIDILLTNFDYIISTNKTI